MKKISNFFSLLVLLTIPQITFAQEKKPKVVLVLSGGGAKGVAHIPLLQALDSLHIVPDLIVGNSMGSVIGGLYAMGYSGDSIEKITKHIDWDKLLGGSLSYNKVSVEEKSEFDRYLVGVDIKNGKPSSLSSLLNDQNLREYLSELTFPAHNIKDFDKLPIPFRAMATDLVNGKEVILSKGSLAYAMRASMSLPAVFKPMPYEETILVDGGVMNNFPTDIAKQMGADIIIGSDVGGGMEPIDKLDNFATVLVQTSMFPSNIKDPENRKRCTILVDHLPNLRFSTGDFAKSNEIYQDGKIATKLNIEALTALAEKLKGYDQKTHKLPQIPNEVLIDSIIYKNLSEENRPLVIARTNLKSHGLYTTKDLVEGLNRAMGTNLFNQITYHYTIKDGDKVVLILNCFEHSKNQLHASLHYDTFRGVGLILNYTGRNILGQSSRFLTTIDIAEQPRFRIDYQKNFGKEKQWWWGTEAFASFLKQKIFINGSALDNMIYNNFELNNEFNRNLNSLKSYVGFSLNYNYTEVRPKNASTVNDQVYIIKNYHFNNIEFNAHYSFNDMNTVFFANKGTIIKANMNRSLLQDVNLSYLNNAIPSVNSSTNGYTKLGFDFEKRLVLKHKITGIVGFNANFIFEDKLQSDQPSFSQYGYGSKYFLGGIFPSPESNSFTFPGLNEDELNVTQFMAIKLGAQVNLAGKIYLTPHFNVATVGFDNFNEYITDSFSPKGDWQDSNEASLLMSAGGAISYLSVLGPINFDVSWLNNINNSRLYFSVGLLFNPSN